MADYKVKMNSYNVRLNSDQSNSSPDDAGYKSKMNSYNVKLNTASPHTASQQVGSHSLLSNMSDVEVPDVDSLSPDSENVLTFDLETNKYKVIPIETIISESIEDEVVEIVQNNMNIDIIDAGEF